MVMVVIAVDLCCCFYGPLSGSIGSIRLGWYVVSVIGIYVILWHRTAAYHASFMRCMAAVRGLWGDPHLLLNFQNQVSYVICNHYRPRTTEVYTART